MSVVVTFERFKPPRRYDSLPFTEARIEEADAEDGTFAQIDVYTLTPTDPDPSDPAYRSFTTELGTDDELWYRIVFADASGDTSEPTIPLQNVATSELLDVEPFADSVELARILTVNETTNHDALERVLIAAAGEIITETGRSDFTGWELELVTQVNLARAEELWRQMKVPWGIVMDTTGVSGPTYLARDTFARHAVQLQPLKVDWGIA
jgi:hypothetical protein